MAAPERSTHTTVVRIRRRGGVVVQGCDVYIGRACNMGGWRLPASDWANPFTIKDCGGSADVALQRFREYLSRRPDLLARLPELRGKVLGCWCAPRPCHGTVLAQLADALPESPLGK